MRSVWQRPTMKLQLALAATALLCTSCVTSDDLRAVADSVASLEAKDVVTEGDIAVAKNDILQVAQLVEDRTKGFVNGIGQAGEGGVIGIAAALALNAWRNRTRKKALEDVGNGGPTA